MSTEAKPARAFTTVAVATTLLTRLNTLGARFQFRASNAPGVRVSRSAVLEELLDCWDEHHPNEASQPKSASPGKKK